MQGKNTWYAVDTRNAGRLNGTTSDTSKTPRGGRRYIVADGSATSSKAKSKAVCFLFSVSSKLRNADPKSKAGLEDTNGMRTRDGQ